MAARHILSLLSLLAFFGWFFKNRFTTRAYLLGVLYIFPFIDLTVTPDTMGSFTVFDAVTYFSFFVLIQDFAVSLRRNKTYFVLFWLFAVILFVGCLRSEFIVNSLLSIFRQLAIFIYASLFITEYYRDPLIAPAVVKGLRFACIVSMVYLLIQLFVGIRFTVYPYLNQNVLDSTTLRYPSYFQDPQMFSQFLAMTSLLFLIKSDKPKEMYLNYAFFFLAVLSIFLSGGRSGLFGLCVGAVIIFIFGENKYRLFILACCVVGFLCISLFPHYFSIFSSQEGYDEAYEVRHSIWKSALGFFSNNPIWGLGFGNYGKYVEAHSLSGYYVIDGEIVYYGTESGYLRILVETGILGSISASLFILLPIVNAIKARIKKINNGNIYYLVAAVAAWLTAFSTLYTLSDDRTLVVLASMLCLLVTSTKRITTINEQQNYERHTPAVQEHLV
jgi:O-antigen ligase